MAFFIELIRYLFSGVVFYISPRVTVRDTMYRDLSWPQVSGVILVLAVAQPFLKPVVGTLFSYDLRKSRAYYGYRLR